MGEIIKKRPNNAFKFEPITGAGEYTKEELQTFDVNNFVDFQKLNEEVKSLTIPEGFNRVRVTVAVEVHYTSGEKKQKYVKQQEIMDKLKQNNQRGV